MRFREKSEIYSCCVNRIAKYTMVSNKNVRINGVENRRLRQMMPNIMSDVLGFMVRSQSELTKAGSKMSSSNFH